MRYGTNERTSVRSYGEKIRLCGKRTESKKENTLKEMLQQRSTFKRDLNSGLTVFLYKKINNYEKCEINKLIRIFNIVILVQRYSRVYFSIKNRPSKQIVAKHDTQMTILLK